MLAGFLIIDNYDVFWVLIKGYVALIAHLVKLVSLAVNLWDLQSLGLRSATGRYCNWLFCNVGYKGILAIKV